MPLFSWMKWSRAEREKAQDEGASTGVSPSCTLIRELLWHVEERECMAREVEQEHKLAHNTTGYPHWLQSYPRLRTLIPASEHRQLEHLCAQIHPMHTATVLSRYIVHHSSFSTLFILAKCVQNSHCPHTRMTIGKRDKTLKERGVEQSCQGSHFVLLSQK